jgi:hypothetical protein
MSETQPGQTQVKYIRVKRKVQTTKNSRLQVPDLMVLWELPLEYVVQWVEREDDTVTLRLKIIREGGKEPQQRREVVVNE